ncbi:MAG: CoA transferase [Candidatus Dormibacteraceae bacterium]
MDEDRRRHGPNGGTLLGLKVVEFDQVVAGPLAGALLADQGADVVHVEPPGAGDPARSMGPTKNGVHLWWKVSGRNKRSVTIDLRTPAGRELAYHLVRWADVAIVSLRTSTLHEWGLDWPAIHTLNPRLILLQITGFGANTSMADTPGFGKVGEARSGVVSITGFADGPPVHTGFSHGDAVTGLMGAYSILAALHRRNTDADYQGEWIDLALFEPLFRLIEWQVIVHDQLGTIPQRSGNSLAVAPAAVVNTYLSRDQRWITVTSGTPRSVLNIVRALGLAEDEYATVADQARGRAVIDERLKAWIADRDAEEALSVMAQAGVVASRIFDMADIMSDPIYAERGDIATVDDPQLGQIRMQAVVPRFENRPGEIWRTAPLLGEDNEVVFSEWLRIPPEELERLRSEGAF